MYDILLGKDGDIDLTEKGDFKIADSLSQKIVIRLKWFLSEWRWNVKEGLPYWERMFKKGPEVDLFLMALRNRLQEIDEVQRVMNLSASINKSTRVCTINYAVRTTRDEILREEVIFDAEVWSN